MFHMLKYLLLNTNYAPKKSTNPQVEKLILHCIFLTLTPNLYQIKNQLSKIPAHS